MDSSDEVISELSENDWRYGLHATFIISRKSTDSWVIANVLIEKLQKEKEVIEETEMDSETKKTQLRDKKKILKVMNSLKKYADENHMECNFIILMASQFNSGFGKADFSSTNIVFHTMLHAGGIATPFRNNRLALTAPDFEPGGRTWLGPYNDPVPVEDLHLPEEDLNAFQQHGLSFPWVPPKTVIPTVLPFTLEPYNSTPFDAFS